MVAIRTHLLTPKTLFKRLPGALTEKLVAINNQENGTETGIDITSGKSGLVVLSPAKGFFARRSSSFEELLPNIETGETADGTSFENKVNEIPTPTPSLSVISGCEPPRPPENFIRSESPDTERQINIVNDNVDIKLEEKYKKSLNDFFIYLETLENILTTITIEELKKINDKQKKGELKNLIKEIEKFKTENEENKNIKDVIKKFTPIYKKIKKMDKIFKRHLGFDTKSILSEINKFESDNLKQIESAFHIKKDHDKQIRFDSETTPYQGHKHFIGSRDNDEYQLITHEIASSVFKCKFEDNSKEIRMIRSGTVSLPRKNLEKDTKLEAELQRVESLATVVASEQLKGLENYEEGKTYTVLCLSDNVMSAYNFFSYREKDRITDHKAAMEIWNKKKKEMIMHVTGKDSKEKVIKVRVEFIPVCFSVNSFMFSWLGKFLGIGRNYIDKYNEESLKKLIGDPSGGLVDKFLEENNQNYDQQKIKEIENLYKEVKEGLKNKDHFKSIADSYNLSAKILRLGDSIGLMAHFNCKSGKDRTSMLDDVIKYQVAEDFMTSSNEGKKLSDQKKDELKKNILVNSHGPEIQKRDTHLPGNKVMHESSFLKYLGPDYSLKNFWKIINTSKLFNFIRGFQKFA